MAWNGNWFPFNRETVLRLAPKESGVYGLATDKWIYAGESKDIEERLLQHLAGDNECINRSRPTLFSWEPWPANQRVARQNQVIAEFRPSCNQMFG